MHPTLHPIRLPTAVARLAAWIRSAEAPSSRASPGVNADDLGPAFDCFSAGRWEGAFEHLKALGDAGNRDASRIALMLATHGARLFGRSFVVAPAQRHRWSRSASEIE